MLAGCLRSALAGQRQLVLVAGEPGAGKTRLAEEAIDQARELGLACALGRASDDEGSPPYWPFLQVFRALPGRPPVELSGGLADGDEPRGSARERFRLFEVTTEALMDSFEHPHVHDRGRGRPDSRRGADRARPPGRDGRHDIRPCAGTGCRPACSPGCPPCAPTRGGCSKPAST